MELKRLFHDASLCDGCGFCQLACSLAHCQQWNHYQSRIKIINTASDNASYALFCAQCEEAPCITACLMNTIFKDASRGTTIRNLNQCIGCRACEMACPFNAAAFDVIQEKVLNCDLCEGEPLCVACCPNHALSFEYPADQIEKYRSQAASQKIASSLFEKIIFSGEEGEKS